MTGTGSPDMDERSLAAVTIVLTCGLRLAFASPDTSTSTDMSHSQQKDKVEKTNKQKNNKNLTVEDPQSGDYLRCLDIENSCCNPLFMRRYMTSADIWCLSVLFC